MTLSQLKGACEALLALVPEAREYWRQQERRKRLGGYGSEDMAGRATPARCSGSIPGEQLIGIYIAQVDEPDGIMPRQFRTIIHSAIIN